MVTCVSESSAHQGAVQQQPPQRPAAQHAAAPAAAAAAATPHTFPLHHHNTTTPIHITLYTREHKLTPDTGPRSLHTTVRKHWRVVDKSLHNGVLSNRLATHQREKVPMARRIVRAATALTQMQPQVGKIAVYRASIVWN